MSRKAEWRIVRRRSEGGVAAVLTMVGMTCVLLMVGLGIDITHFYLVKTELQHAADAAALAGASALNSSAAGIRDASTRARAVMNRTDFNSNLVTIPAENVTFGVNLEGVYISQALAELVPATIRFIRVTTPPAPVRVFFASFVLGGTVDIAATATAGRSVSLNNICGFVPLFVVDYDDTPYTPGNLYTFRAAPAGGPAPGNYQLLAMAGSGGRDLSEGLAGGASTCAQAGDEYAVDTEPGIKAGPVQKGINTRFDDYNGTTFDPAEYPPDTNIQSEISYEQYLAGSPLQAPTHTGVQGRRVVLIPIVKASEIDNGRNVVNIDRFGVFFLRSKVGNGSGGELVAEYIDKPITIGQGGYDPSGGPGNPLLTVPVLYK